MVYIHYKSNTSRAVSLHCELIFDTVLKKLGNLRRGSNLARSGLNYGITFHAGQSMDLVDWQTWWVTRLRVTCCCLAKVPFCVLRKIAMSNISTMWPRQIDKIAVSIVHVVCRAVCQANRVLQRHTVSRVTRLGKSHAHAWHRRR